MNISTARRKCCALGLVGVILILSGCINSTNIDEISSNYHYIPAATRTAALSKITGWNIKGSFSVQEHGKTHMASYSWTQSSPRDYNIIVSSALNLYNYTLKGHVNSAVLWKDSTHAVTGKSPERVMQKVMGYSLPLSNLYYWVRSIAAPGRVVKIAHDKYGHLTYLQQQGWEIRWGGFSTRDGIDFPTLIVLARPGTNIRITIRYWVPMVNQHFDESAGVKKV